MTKEESNKKEIQSVAAEEQEDLVEEIQSNNDNDK